MKETVLYIDDEKENLDSFQLAFWSNYNVLLAGSTKEAEPLLEENDVKLVVTDQKMADETGIEFIERVKPKYPDLLFVVLTAYAELDIVLDAINTGVFQFIQKPWEKKEMQQVIANAIDRYNLQKENKELLIELKKKNDELSDSNDELLSLARQFRERKRKSEESEQLLDAIFKSLPLILLLIDEDRKVIKINKTGLEAADKSENEALGLRGGDVLDCINSFDKAGGCGASDACNNCLINNTIENSFKYQTDYNKVKATLSVKRAEKVTQHEVLISTSFIESRKPLVLVAIEDVTKANEVIALK